MHIRPITEAKHVDSYLVGPLLAVLFTEPIATSAETYHHILYTYRPDPQSPPTPGNPPPRIMTIMALNDKAGNNLMRVVTDAGHRDGPINPQGLQLEGFTQYALALVARRYNIHQNPVRMPMPNADAPFGG